MGVRTDHSQRVATYRTGPEGNTTANDNIAAEAKEGITQIEAFLADAALALV